MVPVVVKRSADSLEQHTSIPGTNSNLDSNIVRCLRLTLDSLVGTGSVDKGAIFNSEGTSVWATTPGFSVTPAELKQVVAAYKDNQDIKSIQGSGFYIAGEKYITLRADDRSLYGKKVC